MIMTQEEMLRALSAIQINGNISQLCMGDGYMTVNNYRQPSKEQEQNNDGDYFDSTAFSNALKRLAQHMEQTRTIHWSHVYLYLRRNMSLDEMSASAFGRFIEEHGGPNEQKVRKDGNYQPSSRELLRDKAVIESVSAFFPVD